MRKNLLWMCMVLLFTGCTAVQTKMKEIFFPAAPVSKSISFSVYAGKNYSAPVYHDALASLHIVIVKTWGSKETVVWDKTYQAMELRNFPSLQNAVSENIVIGNIKDGKEKLEVTYTLTYNTKGSVLQMSGDTIIAANTKPEQVYISL